MMTMAHEIERDELDQYLGPGAAGSWRWEFPNGHHVSVIPDPRRVLRFEVLTSSPTDAATGHIVAGLSTEQVEAKLAEVFALPSAEQTVALVTVDDQGRLTPESTVTIGEWTWPVPERTEGAGIAGPARIGAALAQRNWKIAGEASEPQWSPTRWEHVIEVRVEPIEADMNDDEEG